MDRSKLIRLSGIAYDSLVNGTGGFRRVFFSQGCNHNCKGCFNPDTHDFKGGELRNMDALLEDLYETPYIRGVTFSGGDPLEQSDKFAYMAKSIKEHGLNIWCYTGYTWEYILEHMNDGENHWDELLPNIDVLIDGKFMEELHEEGLKFKGSSNQRIINVPESLKQDSIVLLEL